MSKRLTKTNTKNKQKWMTNNVIDIMEASSNVKEKYVSEYEELDKVTWQECKGEKDAWWNKQCDEMEGEFL